MSVKGAEYWLPLGNSGTDPCNDVRVVIITLSSGEAVFGDGSIAREFSSRKHEAPSLQASNLGDRACSSLELPHASPFTWSSFMAYWLEENCVEYCRMQAVKNVRESTEQSV